MKKTIIINTHIFSKSWLLYKALQDSWLIHPVYRKDRLYLNNNDLFVNNNIAHKSRNKKAMFLDILEYNYEICPKKIDYSKLILINYIRDPIESIQDMIDFKKMKLKNAFNYYFFRLLRIIQISQKSKNVFISHKDIIEKKESVEKYLRTICETDDIVLPCLSKEKQNNTFQKKTVELIEKKYEYYLYKIKQNNKLID